MPVGKYETFAQCVSDQKARGHDEDSAQRICGHIEKMTKKGRKDKKK